jgi:hypothetical protein
MPKLSEAAVERLKYLYRPERLAHSQNRVIEVAKRNYDWDNNNMDKIAVALAYRKPNIGYIDLICEQSGITILPAMYYLDRLVYLYNEYVEKIFITKK